MQQVMAILERHCSKLRLLRYDQNAETLEIKVKEGHVGTKYSYPLGDFHLDGGFCERYFREVLRTSGLPGAVDLLLNDVSVVLLNRYYRHYYVSRDGRFRLTVDSRLSFHKANGALGNRFAHRQRNHRDVVVELKYGVEHEPGASCVAGFFPFRVTRNSKYVQGIERVYF